MTILEVYVVFGLPAMALGLAFSFLYLLDPRRERRAPGE